MKVNPFSKILHFVSSCLFVVLVIAGLPLVALLFIGFYLFGYFKNKAREMEA